MAPFRGARLTPVEECFNKDMSTKTTNVEWGYGKIGRFFAFLDLNKILKVLLQPVGKVYVVGAILANCDTCLYGSQTRDVFDFDPPRRT